MELDNVEYVVVERGRGELRRVAFELPHDTVGPGEVALRAGQTDREHGLLIIAVAGDEQPAREHGRRDDVFRQTGAFPELRARREVVTAHALRGADDYLRLTFVLDDERRGPGSFFIARHFPQLATGALVEGVEKRVTFVVPVHDKS